MERIHGCTQNGAFAQNDRAQDHPQDSKDGGKQAGPAAKKIRREVITKTLVAARDPGRRRARSEARRLYPARPEGDRGLAEALGRTQLAPQERRLSFGALDADLLYHYINRAGKTLPKTRRERLQRAKGELKRQFGRE
jgi:uncharacterized protein DUF3175